MGYEMIIVIWFIIFLLLSGMLVIKVIEIELENLKREDGNSYNIDQFELFLHMYYSSDFGGKLEFILIQGARYWSIVLMMIIDNIKNKIRKR